MSKESWKKAGDSPLPDVEVGSRAVVAFVDAVTQVGLQSVRRGWPLVAYGIVRVIRHGVCIRKWQCSCQRKSKFFEHVCRS